MDRAILREHLDQSRHRAAMGEHHFAPQERLIAELDRDGHDTTGAVSVLASLTRTQELHELDIERLLRDLAE
ncbi:hypothetical protein GCM10010987_72210 [Bradyrhizobium guangdongense]|uniref:Uncharacterized protein n=1 Tax=Bradyrhizobium guangdongense TaxID=1325090 RepID=A0AA87WFY9_9BRAD|nr:hypothetical protein XH86_12510 [Bradyrhizobium guangdongense]GGI33000.1 hypothetical protein GCM10010987_72210 [Bradyrhizobium guangdongense]